MNMIMHGDGHGGIHFHDGLLDINGIFEGRFDLVLTNPPFGANVGDDQKVGTSEQARVLTDEDYVRDCRRKYLAERDQWEESHRRMVAAAKAREPILNLFEIGKDKPNRPTEIVFLERCIRLLKPGGRMGMVLPDGNLNNPSLGWLRRWAEGHARLVAVVSLPEEVFRSSDTSAKTSIVFLQKFTAEDAARWERLWTEAHATHDAMFAAQREAVAARAERPIACGGDPALEKILVKAEKLGLRRSLPAPRVKDPPPYPRGVVQSEIGKPRWVPASAPTPRSEKGRKAATESKKKARQLRQQFEAAWTEIHNERSEELRRELRVGLRKIDREHSRALWTYVREGFDYPVFTAAPAYAGITSTGDTGEHVPSDFPQVLDAWTHFTVWVENGANEASMPQFAESK
jgi:type I restriction enzyme M protein